ncbi:NosD domain-containing protein [Chloroflexota bacterium]
MKRKFSKILGVGLTLALLASLLLTASPVLATSVDQVDADTAPDEISVAGTYTISYRADKVQTTADTITVLFPDDTDVTAAAVAGTTGVVFTSGFGTNSGNASAVGVVADKDDRTVIITLTTLTGDIGVMSDVQLKITGVINPTEPGMYTLDVKTSDSTTYAGSTEYKIETPTVGGFVYVYNPSDILMATYGGSSALNDAVGYYDDEGFEINVGPGTYVLTGNITLSGKNLTVQSADGNAETTIDSDGNDILITTAKGITLDGFTIDDAATGVSIGFEDATVTNCVITDATVAGVTILAAGLDATVSNNVIEDCAIGINFAAIAATDMDDVDITGNEITETSGTGGIVFGGGTANVDVTGNTITGNDNAGIYFADAAPNVLCSNISISGNTISLNEEDGIDVAADDVAPTKLAIIGNDILDNGDDGIVATIWDEVSDYVMFNNIIGNDGDSVVNLDTTDEINARFNWWGTADDDDFDETGDVEVEPWLEGTQDSTVSGSKVAVNGATALDAKTAADVKVSGVADVAGAKEAAVISAAKYTTTPADALDDSLAFYDVFILLETGFDTTDVNAKLKFYDSAITSGSVASFWTGDFWAECSEQEARDGIVYVTVSDDTVPALDELEETMFGVASGEATDAVTTPVLTAPEVGDSDVSLLPTFAWDTVAGADSYDFELADNALFVVPIIALSDGYPATAYTQVGALDYSTAYYWRVRAIDGDEMSAWAASVFTTMVEPVEMAEEEETVAPPVIEPIVEVTVPPATPITPSWIYVIIGVGAVLVIALLVLIVRTRRVA